MKSPQDILSLIEKEIKYKRVNSLWSHFLTVIRFDNDALSGQLSKDGFKVWIYSYWVGIFHPVIHGKIYSTDDKLQIDLKYKMNPLGRLVTIALLTGLGYLIVTGLILQGNNSWTFLWKRIIMGIFLFCIPIFVFGLAYRYHYRKEIEGIKNMCQQWLGRHTD